jgi:hypothetical protein
MTRYHNVRMQVPEDEFDEMLKRCVAKNRLSGSAKGR